MSRRKNQPNNVSKEVMLRDKTTGRWIKRSDEETELSENSIPNTLIQIQQNNIYYTDVNLVIRHLVDNRNKEKIRELETKYNTIIDALDNYRAYSSGIDTVFYDCQQNAGYFDAEIRRTLEGFDTSCENKVSVKNLLDLSKAYLKILFVYLYSAFILHKNKVKNDTVIFGKINLFKEYIQDLLEKILIPKRWGDQLDYSGSLYAMFIYNNEFNIKYIETLIYYDRRFETSLDLIRQLNNNALRVDNYPDFLIQGRFKKHAIRDNSIGFIEELINLLRDIDRLKNIREEVGKIEKDSIFTQFELEIKKG